MSEDSQEREETLSEGLSSIGLDSDSQDAEQDIPADKLQLTINELSASELRNILYAEAQRDERISNRLVRYYDGSRGNFDTIGRDTFLSALDGSSFSDRFNQGFKRGGKSVASSGKMKGEHFMEETVVRAMKILLAFLMEAERAEFIRDIENSQKLPCFSVDLPGDNDPDWVMAVPAVGEHGEEVKLFTEDDFRQRWADTHKALKELKAASKSERADAGKKMRDAFRIVYGRE
ncbi:hypothetical protein NA57DRAFT_54133 [Rhizodiscina lignyota]|uniref:Uncharacterized protein n=1 Tax=Rhizodiscina lignyota TaxID=1504668 RepID=A0A9P4IQ62_9PEZI|nr:hypothetical protein NA57DRAFT_54133 [Rhizodiscina lignyota]